MARTIKTPGETTPTAEQADEALAHITAEPTEAEKIQVDTPVVGDVVASEPPDWALKILAGQARIEAKLRSMSLPQAQATQPQQGIPPIQQPKQPAQVLTAQGWGSKES